MIATTQNHQADLLRSPTFHASCRRPSHYASTSAMSYENGGRHYAIASIAADAIARRRAASK